MTIPASAVKISGKAATTAALAGAAVSLKDTAGRQLTTTTKSDGTFDLTGEAISYPALVRVDVPSPGVAGLKSVYVVIDKPQEGAVYVSPLTTAQVAALSRGESDVLYAAMGVGTSASAALSSDRIATTETALRNAISRIVGASTAQTFLGTATSVKLAPITLEVPAIAALLDSVSNTFGLGGLSAQLSTVVASTGVGCDSMSLRTLTDGSERPACKTGSNFALGWTVGLSGGFRPVKQTPPASALAWAELLAGGTGSGSWKHYAPNTTDAATQTALVAHLKSKISDLWSNNGGISFPETYGLDSGPVTNLISSVLGIQWDRLGKLTKATQASNLTYEFQELRTRLAGEMTRDAIFSFVPVESVTLASPFSIDRERTLEAMGPKINSFAREWLQSPANLQALPAPAPEIVAVDRAFTSLLEFISTTGLPSPSQVQTYATAWINAANALPSAYAQLRQTSIVYANSFVQVYTACGSAGTVADCQRASSENISAGSAYSSAYLEAVRLSTSGQTETAGQFYNRFLRALAAFIQDQWKNQHGALYPVATTAPLVSYTPVVVLAQLYDGLNSPECCLTAAERAAPRRGSLYVVAGETVGFELNLDGTANVSALAAGSIVRRDFDIPPLNGPRLQKVLDPMLVVTGLGGSVDAIVLACSTADTACMNRLSRSLVSTPRTTGTGPLFRYSTGFWNISNLIAATGGLTEADSSVRLGTYIGP